MEVFLFAVLLGLIPAMIASNKGRSFVGWWIFGAAIFIIALPAALLAKPATGEGSPFRKCEYCAEDIKAEAKVCKHCGRDVPPGNESA